MFSFEAVPRAAPQLGRKKSVLSFWMQHFLPYPRPKTSLKKGEGALITWELQARETAESRGKSMAVSCAAVGTSASLAFEGRDS